MKSAQRYESQERFSTTKHLERVFLLRRSRCSSVPLKVVQRTSGIEARAWISYVCEARRCIGPGLGTSCSWPFVCMGCVQSGLSYNEPQLIISIADILCLRTAKTELLVYAGVVYCTMGIYSQR